MPNQPQVKNPEIASKIDFFIALHKARRPLQFEPGNRTQYVAAKTYFAMIQRRWRYAEELCLMLDAAGRPGDAKHIWTRTLKIVQQRRSTCIRNAIRLLGRRPDAATWRRVDARILAAMMLHGWQTGYCCAGQRAIGFAAGYSRQTVNATIKRLETAGLIERVSYDWRGKYEWQPDRRRKPTWHNKWCIVFSVPLVGAPRRQPPTAVDQRPRTTNRRLWDSVKQRRQRKPKFTDLPKFRGFRLPHQDPP